jgi:hypothetical protein
LHLLFVYLLDLLVLILDNGDVFLLSAGLLTEFGGVLLSAALVLLFHLLFLGLCLFRNFTDLITEACVFNADGLCLFLKLSLLSFELGHKLHMVSHYLVVENLLFLELLHYSLYFLCNLQETLSLLLFIGRFIVSQVHKNGLIVMALILDLLM